MSSPSSSQPHTYNAQPQPQQQYYYAPPPQAPPQQPQTALMPHPQHQPSYSAAPQHLTPYDAYANQQHGGVEPLSEQRPSAQSHHSHRSHRSHRSQREKYDEVEKRPSLGDTVVVVWESILGAFSRRR
ncbi:hypothetical protein BU23DRAFT_255769 [Bimuria novae-zelandiae CBS 107.79]|uniref:Uncharacterized protein n=1 Tax=Bimuria novae-zelandiae CBS 107.79 TaxID=1447943 RepID=A0A6A5V6H7_9PLEO|nr:hypothetical protein BU23DRAFT_255769 [Bimuria novae-zelandiae CBS 107.79]